MKKITKWLKERPFIKLMIVLEVINSVVSALLGDFMLCFIWILIAALMFIIDLLLSYIAMYEKENERIARQYEKEKLISRLEGSCKGYWYDMFKREELYTQLCQKKIACSHFLRELNIYEAKIEEDKKIIQEAKDNLFVKEL